MRIPYPQILNEQSFQESPSREVFVERMRGLKDVMARMREIGFAYVAVKSRGVYFRRCVCGMTLREWLFEKGVASPEERTLKEFFRAVISKTPVFEDAPDEFAGICDFDMFFNGRRIYPNPDGEIPAFLVSLKNQLPTVALHTGEFSGKRDMVVGVQELDEFGDLQMHDEALAVVSDVAGAESFRGQSVERIVRELTTGRAVIDVQSELWPDMSFSHEALEQLERFDVKSGLLVGALIKLYGAFTKCVKSRSRDIQREFGSRKSLIMTESETVQNQFAETRTFHWSDGIRLCLPHLRINLQYRIHFLPDFDSGKLYVGYVGPHLPTGKFH